MHKHRYQDVRANNSTRRSSTDILIINNNINKRSTTTTIINSNILKRSATTIIINNNTSSSVRARVGKTKIVDIIRIIYIYIYIY